MALLPTRVSTFSHTHRQKQYSIYSYRSWAAGLRGCELKVCVTGALGECARLWRAVAALRCICLRLPAVVPCPAGVERWPFEYSYDQSQGYPTLLPHQLTYTLAANNQPPPPYSREPLVGHLSLGKAEDFQAEIRQEAVARRQLASQNELIGVGGSQDRRDCDSQDGQGPSTIDEGRLTHRRHSRRHRRQMAHSRSDPMALVDRVVNAEPELSVVDPYLQNSNEDSSNLASLSMHPQTPTELPLPSMPTVSVTHDIQSDEVMSSVEMSSRPCSRQSLRNSSTLFVPASEDLSQPPHLIRRSPTPTSSSFVPPAFLPRPGSDNESVLPLSLPPPLRSIATPERNLPPLQSITPSAVNVDTSPALNVMDQHGERSKRQLNPIPGASRKSLSFPRMIQQPQPFPSRLPPLPRTVNNDTPSGSPVRNQDPTSEEESSTVRGSANVTDGTEQRSNCRSWSGSVEDAPNTSTVEASQDSNSFEAEQFGSISPQGSVSRQSSENSHELETVTSSDKVDHQIPFPQTVSPSAVT